MDFETDMRNVCSGTVDYFTDDILLTLDLYISDSDKVMCKDILIDEFTKLVENICDEITKNA